MRKGILSYFFTQNPKERMDRDEQKKKIQNFYPVLAGFGSDDYGVAGIQVPGQTDSR